MSDIIIDRTIAAIAIVVMLLSLYLYLESVGFYAAAYKLWETRCNIPITVNWTLK